MKENRVDISVIIPVFNSYEYIDECLESVKKQSFLSFEVIIVDDGSVDKSIEKINAFAESDDRIKFFRKNNGGVSSARNYGLNVANGKYVLFLDSDDTLEPDCLKELYELASDTVDWISGGLQWVSGNSILRKVKVVSELVMYKGVEFSNYFENLYKRGMLNSPCGRLYKKDLIGDIRFDESITLGEDLLFNYKYIEHCNNSFIFLPQIVYNYCMQNDSSATKTYRKDDIYQILLLHSKTKRMKQVLGLECFLGDCADEVLCRGVITILQVLFYSDMPKNGKKRECEKIFSNSVVREAFQCKYEWTVKDRIMQLICKIQLFNILKIFFGIKKFLSKK